jgi:signal transduction histidine kinase
VVSIALVLLLFMSAFLVILHRKRSRELAQNNAVKDKFFSIISHDLKNPAVAQRDGLKIIVKNIDKWDKSDVTDYLQDLFQSADGLVELIKNLLNWSQLQTKRQALQPFTFELVEALKPDIHIVKNMAEGKNITFDTLFPPTAIISGDKNMLVTVVRNLLANAVKFTPEGGTITLEIAPLNPPEGGKKAPVYTISVSDTGIGMTEEQKQIIFKLDKQQSREGTAGEQGTGLGLIVCEDMLKKHGSKLEVESVAGKGSRFWF